MTSSSMGRAFLAEASGRVALVQLAVARGLWPTAVREAQECVELFLKGALRLVGTEPSRTHDVGEVLRRERARFPDWFATEIDHLAAVSAELAGDRGLAFYGDERNEIAPRDLFEEKDARRALDHLVYVGGLCERLGAATLEVDEGSNPR